MDHDWRSAGLYWVKFVKRETCFPNFSSPYGPEWQKGHMNQSWEVDCTLLEGLLGQMYRQTGAVDSSSSHCPPLQVQLFFLTPGPVNPQWSQNDHQRLAQKYSLNWVPASMLHEPPFHSPSSRIKCAGFSEVSDSSHCPGHWCFRRAD